MSTFSDRVIRAARLDVNLYEEVEADESSTGQAGGVVVLSSLAAGIGAIGLGGVSGLLVGTIAALVGWLVWAFLTYLIGTKLLPEPQTEASYGQLLRTLGFASAPGLIRVFGIIPILGAIVYLIAGIWMLVAMVVAVRQALDYQSSFRAVGVCLIGWIVYIILSTILLAPFVNSDELGVG